MDGEIIEAKPSGKWKWAIALFPALLMLSAAGAVWFHWKSGRETTIDARLAASGEVLSAQELQEHVRKLTAYIGPRGWDSKEELKGLRRTIAYVEGTLSPQNYGFKVHRENSLSWNGELWPILWVDLAPEEVTQWILLEVRYDGEPEDLALVLAVLNEMREREYRRGIRVVFREEFDARGRGERLEGVRAPRKLEGVETTITIRNFGRDDLQVSPGWGDPGLDFHAKSVPKGEFEVLLASSGAKLTDQGLLVRARQLRDFLTKAAFRP